MTDIKIGSTFIDPIGRPSRDQVFMMMACTIARRGTCPRASVGAIIVKDGRPVSMGYNGAPPGQPHCDTEGCGGVDEGGHFEAGCQRAIHAELNAIAWAARSGTATEGATIYCTHQPCRRCGQAILSAGIERVVYMIPYRAPFQFPLEIQVTQIVSG